MRLKYTDADLRDAVRSSTTIAATLSKIGLVPAGGNYATIKAKIKGLDLDTSHFLGHNSNKGKKIHKSPIVSDEDTFCRNSKYLAMSKLRKRMLRQGFKQHVCEECGLTEWRSNPIPLELHHVNGDRHDNRLENLQLLCPNCHALTDTYRGKNIKTIRG